MVTDAETPALDDGTPVRTVHVDVTGAGAPYRLSVAVAEESIERVRVEYADGTARTVDASRLGTAPSAGVVRVSPASGASVEVSYGNRNGTDGSLRVPVGPGAGDVLYVASVGGRVVGWGHVACDGGRVERVRVAVGVEEISGGVACHY